MTVNLVDFAGVVAGVSGIVLAWRSFKVKSRSAIIEDMETLRNALKEENERLLIKVNLLIEENKQLREEVKDLTARVEYLEVYYNKQNTD